MVAAVDPTASSDDRDAQVNSAKNSATVRKQLYLRYADVVCVDPGGKPFTVAKQDFLGRGGDQKGKGDFQGCGEFNPVMIFSRDEQQEFDSPEEAPVRDQENAANRRVVIFLFRPGIRIDPGAWPCPARVGPTGSAASVSGRMPPCAANGDERRFTEETATRLPAALRPLSNKS